LCSTNVRSRERGTSGVLLNGKAKMSRASRPDLFSGNRGENESVVSMPLVLYEKKATIIFDLSNPFSTKRAPVISTEL